MALGLVVHYVSSLMVSFRAKSAQAGAEERPDRSGARTGRTAVPRPVRVAGR